MGKIVAIGGGELRQGETEKIDRFIVGLSKKDAPRLLFIPTASNDAEGYIELVKDKYGQLACKVDTLCLVTNIYSDEQIREKIFNSDIIYVGGGDTERMMEKWKEHRVDVYLKEAYKKGIVLSGLSAGSICWFVFGHSDSEYFKNQNQWQYTRVYGLGLIPAAHCPHYNEEGRETFDGMMFNESIPGFALENSTALVEIDGKYQILKADEKRKAYILRSKGNCIIKEELPEGEFYF
ncbi:Type 1 glutamine amidotransferase-like domain-containing protein [Lutispora thermophila]|uniref:Peptidase family S51 n=1 Tax=Lutispora thermophila DSM 19022 TaxID=1122184 RepID=A0A1M6BCU5_9FIRM|nr:peptidase E [Lutispora thermophila]SHI46564.1 Peptidase family S51 [Lutispora thermophila DSM 19022]